MESQSYYRVLGASDNVCRTDTPLCVNCAGVCVMPKPFVSRSAVGREDFYLQYLVGGEMDILERGERSVLRPGQAILHYPHRAYQYGTRGGGAVEYYWIHFTGTSARALVERCGIEDQQAADVGVHASITGRFESIFRDLMERDSCFELSACAGLMALLAEMVRRRESACAPRAADDRISRAIAHLHRAYNQPLRVEEIALRAHLSESRFRRLFRQRTGLPPMEYLTRLRLSHAGELMAETSLSVAEIARAVGYEDPLYFSRLFRQKTGASPTEFRERRL